ncbi:hypothetical protein HY416_03150 [Candidatus Kaiserbacteria bacterium]|nr:hypothetical protein [Candidatus Kaiserbacteria bacterium]
MRSFLKGNFAVFLAFLLPLVLVAVVVIGTYLPSAFISTDYDFVYASCSQGQSYSYGCGGYLQKYFPVVNNKLVRVPVEPEKDFDGDGTLDADEQYIVHFFLHDTEKNESHEITEQQAMSFSLNSLLTSPDGITVSNGYDRQADFFFLFGGGSSYGQYLTKGNSRKKLNLVDSGNRYYYQDDFHFVGWVLH